MTWNGWWCPRLATLSVMTGASILLAKAAHVPSGDQRGPKISTHSWLALRLWLLRGEAKCLIGKSKTEQISKWPELYMCFVIHTQIHQERIEDLLAGSV